jgi:hypothetical protein
MSLKTDPGKGMQTVLRPIAYEAIHVPITQQHQPAFKPYSNVPPTSIS